MTTVTLKTSLGDIVLEMMEKEAPGTVKNFLAYVDSGFYRNTLFHRVIPGFMAQGGGMEPGMKQKSGNAPIKNEATNQVPNRRGTVAMARTSVVDSATSQFFINLVDNGFLNFSSPTPQGFGYCVFAKVTSGMDVVDQMAKAETTSRAGHRDVPAKDILILDAVRNEQ